jgi:hypothetical protein
MSSTEEGREIGKEQPASKGRNGLPSPKERLELLLTRQAEVNPDAMLTDVELATLLNCSLDVLRIARTSGGRMKNRTKNLPPHQVLFGRLVRYRYGDVMEWLKSQREAAA